MIGGGPLSSWYSSVMYSGGGFCHRGTALWCILTTCWGCPPFPSRCLHLLIVCTLFLLSKFHCDLFIFWCTVLLFTPLLASISSHYVLIQCSFDSLHLFFTCLSSSLYFCKSALAFLLSSIRSKISGVIHFLSFFRFATGMCSFAYSNILSLNICHLSSAVANCPSALNLFLTRMLYLLIITSWVAGW